MTEKNIGREVNKTWEGLRKVKNFIDNSHKPEVIEEFMHYSIQSALNNSSCPSDFDELVKRDALENITKAYIKVMDMYQHDN